VPVKDTSDAPLKPTVMHLYIIVCLLHQTRRLVCKTSQGSQEGSALLTIVDKLES